MPASTASCIAVYTGDCDTPTEIFVTGPVFSRVDLSVKKRIPFTRKSNVEVQFDLLNAFDAVNFTPVFQAGGRGNTKITVTSSAMTGANGQPLQVASPPPLVVNVN